MDGKAAEDLTRIVERIREDVARACAGVAPPNRLFPGSIDGGKPSRDRKGALREGQRSNHRGSAPRGCGSVCDAFVKKALARQSGVR